MGQTEEAGQQPSRLSPGHPGTQRAVPGPHRDSAAGGGAPDPEVGEGEITDDDLAVPGDPRERARVENAARRLADRALVYELKAAEFTGPAFEVMVNELAAYGIATLMAWMRTGEIVRQCLARGRPLADAGRYTAQWSRDDRLEIAVETAARAVRYFVDEVLKPGRWNHRRGATLRTYYVGACLLQFPNIYELWVNEQKRWGVVELAEPGDVETGKPGYENSAWSDPTADEVIRRQQVNEIFTGITDDRTRKAAQMVMLGYEYADAGAEVGLSADAVGGRLYRLRRRPR
jgi:DNA-directed RNA polymerase specialized sigma24 family protein